MALTSGSVVIDFVTTTLWIVFKKKELIHFEETPQREETTAWLMGITVRSWMEVKASLAEVGKKVFGK